MTELSFDQQLAVSHMNGPAMVLAGPGSGKTLVITNRIRYLIDHGARPESILVITFTKAAARQMKTRFERLAAPHSYRVTFGTFHAIFFQILKHAYHYTGENILRDEERYRILASIAASMEITCEDLREWTGEVAAEISRVKAEQIPIDYYYSASCPEEEFRRIYRAYADQLRRMNRIDFDDMMLCTNDLFHARKDILSSWQKHFQYILVDEFQDINALQYKIVRQLAAPENNLFIVGDDEQSIYRFRGSRPEIMLNFPKDYPDAKVLQLSENFRSTAPIVRSSVRVIAENKKRYGKKLYSHSKEGDPVEVMACRDPETEYLYVVNSIRKCLEQGVPASEIAILTRTNLGARGPARKLTEFSIPFCVKDSVPLLYDHWIAQDFFAYLRLRSGKMVRKDFLRVCNRPNRYISREGTDAARYSADRQICVSWTGLRAFYAEKDWMLERIVQFEDDMKMIRNMRPYAAINFLRLAAGYDDFLREYADRRRIDREELLAAADEIQDSAKNYDTLEDWMKDIARYREKMEEMKAEMQFRSAEKEEERVTLATFHSAKGLEFREVFLLDVNEKIIPYKKASLETDLEEERRLFYVGMTRAKEHLHILYLKEQYNKKMEPSRFLECLREQTECRQQNPVEKQRKNGDKTVENTVEKRLKK